MATDGHPAVAVLGDPEPPQVSQLLLPWPRDPTVLSSLVQARKMEPTGKQLTSLGLLMALLLVKYIVAAAWR